MAGPADAGYVDVRGRLRWPRNEQVAAQLKRIGDLLLISGYPQAGAKRYQRLAYAVAAHPEPVETLHLEGRLDEIPGAGAIMAEVIGELLETGACARLQEWTRRTPGTVLEITAIPGLGPGWARRLYRERGIDSLAALIRALDSGRLVGIKGLGRKRLEAIRRYIDCPRN